MSLPSHVTSLPALEFTTNTLAEIMTACFEGYVVPQKVSGDAFNNRFRRENLDLQISRVLIANGRPVAIILVARRGWTARIAAMGIVQDHRGQGLGHVALNAVIEDLRQIGDHRLVLEVIDSNTPAIGLYEKLGFKAQRRLIGYRRPASAGQEAREVVRADPLTIAHRVAEEGEAGLPWIMAPETLAAATAPAQGFALSGAVFAIVEPAPQPSSQVLRTLVVARHERRRGLGRKMIMHLAARYPGQDLVISANFPEELAADFLVSTGFEKTPISQFEMSYDLTT